jgi:lipid-A-disaccharide synthase
MQNSDFGRRFNGESSDQKPVKHYKELAFMGFLEVAMNLRTILKNIKFAKKILRIINQMFWFW